MTNLVQKYGIHPDVDGIRFQSVFVLILDISTIFGNTLALVTITDAKHLGLPRDGKALNSGNVGLTQAYALRNIAADEAMNLKDAPYGETETKSARAQAICSLIRAWAEATDRVRIMRGKPLPGSLRPERKPARKKQISSSPTEEPLDPTAGKP